MSIRPQLGDIWQDTNPRSHERFIRIVAVHERRVDCYNCDQSGQLTPQDLKRQQNNKPRRIMISRLKPGSTGYRKVGES